MPKAPLYNVNAEPAGDMELPEAIFGVKPKMSVVHQVYTALRANARSPWAHAKTRGEVRGGGKKPWKQKGTGRARHGSIRSPIWKGGGVVFGPMADRSYGQKINKKMNQLAVKMCLSDKVKDGKFLVVEEMSPVEKTKVVAAWRGKLPGTGKSTLVVADKVPATLQRAIRNIQRLDTGIAKDLNVMDLMHHQYVIVTKSAVAELSKRFA